MSHTPLKFDNSWRFRPPASLDREIVNEFNELLKKIAVQGDSWDVLEHFKSYFARAAGTSSMRSSSESWADSDLWSYMISVSSNAPLFIAAFYDACQTLQDDNPDLSVPDVPLVNELLEKHGVDFKVEPPNLVRRGTSIAVSAPSPSESLDDTAQ